MRFCRPWLIIAVAAQLCGAGTPADFDRDTGPPSPLGLPSIPFPSDNPYSRASVELGRTLFFDGRLSSNGQVPCAACHQPEHAFSDARPFSPGVNGKLTGRHAPTLINRAWGKTEFWDGRAPSLEQQVIIPITNPDEMGMTADTAAQAIRTIPGYAQLFQEVYGDRTVNFDRIAKALANFVRTIVSGNSAFDHSMLETRTL